MSCNFGQFARHSGINLGLAQFQANPLMLHESTLRLCLVCAVYDSLSFLIDLLVK